MDQVHHIRSVVMPGYSQSCLNGHPVEIGMPSSRCLVPIQDGVFDVRLDRNRIDLCAYCHIAALATQEDALVGFEYVGASSDGNNLEAGDV